VTESQFRIGALSRRAPIRADAHSGAAIEHVGGLTRVLPALAEFAEVNWTTFSKPNQIDLPKSFSFANLSGQALDHNININLTEVDFLSLEQSDWFCTHFIWPLLHDLPMPEIDSTDLQQAFDSIKNICHTLARECVDPDNDGYLVNDFQLSQVPLQLKELEPQKRISFFLHTPWPKSRTRNNFSIEILRFLASGMLAAQVIEFQTQRDLHAFEDFVLENLPREPINSILKVNPVSVNIKDLPERSTQHLQSIDIDETDISYVHIARSDPIKNTLTTIKSFKAFLEVTDSPNARRFLDIFIVPSRQQWLEYQELLAEIVECVESCNSKLRSLGYSPIRLRIGDDYQNANKALTRYDYLIVCSIADGLNLVVKEGAILNARNGVIISSPNVGAMAELENYCVVSRTIDHDGILEALIAATKLDATTREKMSTQLKQQVTQFDASHWAESVISGLKVLETV